MLLVPGVAFFRGRFGIRFRERPEANDGHSQNVTLTFVTVENRRSLTFLTLSGLRNVFRYASVTFELLPSRAGLLLGSEVWIAIDFEVLFVLDSKSGAPRRPPPFRCDGL